MRRLIAAVAAVSTTTVLLTSPPVHAVGSGNNGDPPPEVVVEVGTPGGVEPGTPGSDAGGTTPIPCTFIPVPATPEQANANNEIAQWIVDFLNGLITGLDLQIVLTFYSENATLHAWDQVDARFEQASRADCTNATDPAGWATGDIRWTAVVPPSPDILIEPAVARAAEPINDPVPAINPPDRAPVNLGMWLAAEQAGPIVVRVNLGPLWAEATATVDETTFDMGDGSTVTCAGNGTPLPANRRTTVAEGPCGHTYRDIADVGDTTVTVTSTWAITWRTSAGNSGTQPPVDVSTAVPYEVYEIQTVGRSG